MLTPMDILNKTKNKLWISPFEKIVGIFDHRENLVQIYEYHARNVCYGAAAWAVHHYKQTSPLILDALRDGSRDIFTLKIGSEKLNLEPSYSPAGIERVEIKDNDIYVTYTGLAGGGVGSTFCRGLASGVKGIDLHMEGGGEKLGSATLILPGKTKIQVGLDDTDRPGEGATWSLANEIAYKLGKKDDIEYLNHTLVQLYPGTPEKTTNCVATVLTFAVEPEKLENFKSNILKIIKRSTSSEHTGVAFLEGIKIPGKLKNFTNKARKKIVSLSDATELARSLKIQLIPVTGTRGQIGALAALGLAENQERAVKTIV